MMATREPIYELMTHVRARATELRNLTAEHMVAGPDGPFIPDHRAVEFDQAVAKCLAHAAPDEPPFGALARAMSFAADLKDPDAAADLRVEIVRVIAFGD